MLIIYTNYGSVSKELYYIIYTSSVRNEKKMEALRGTEDPAEVPYHCKITLILCYRNV